MSLSALGNLFSVLAIVKRGLKTDGKSKREKTQIKIGRGEGRNTSWERECKERERERERICQRGMKGECEREREIDR